MTLWNKKKQDRLNLKHDHLTIPLVIGNKFVFNIHKTLGILITHIPKKKKNLVSLKEFIFLRRYNFNFCQFYMSSLYGFLKSKRLNAKSANCCFRKKFKFQFNKKKSVNWTRHFRIILYLQVPLVRPSNLIKIGPG